LGQACNCLTQFTVLLFDLVGAEGIQDVFLLKLAVVHHFGKKLLFFLSEHLDFKLVGFHVNFVGLDLFCQLLRLALLILNFLDDLHHLVILVCKLLLVFLNLSIKLCFHLLELLVPCKSKCLDVLFMSICHILNCLLQLLV